jgi:MFS family permease
LFPTAEAGVRVLRLLRRPIPLAIWGGQVLSVTGDWLYAMAVLWLVFQLTGSAKLMAAVSLAESVPCALAGFLGAGLIARSNRLRAMILLDLASAAFVVVVPVTYLLGLRSVLLLCGVAAILSSLEALFGPALQSVLPDVVPAADIQPMIALTDSTDRLARIAGPGSAGLLLLLMPEIDLFTVDAATFLVSAAALLVVARGLRAAAPDPAVPVQQPTRLLDGIREVLSRPALRVGLTVRGSCNLAWSAFTIGLPFELVHRLHAGLASYGLMLGAFGVGNLIGNLLSGSRRVGGHLMVVYCLSWSLAGTGLLGLAEAPSLALALLAIMWMGIFTPVANVSMDTYIARVIPADRLARVYALQRVTVAAASALGVFAVAAGISATSGPAVIAMAGAWMLLAGLIALIRIGQAAKRRPGSGPYELQLPF